MSIKTRILRESASTLTIHGLKSLGFLPRVYATEDVPLDTASLNSLSILSTIAAAARLVPEGGLRDAAFTPDMHKASTVPVGTVLDVLGSVFPAVVGNDIGCGMALAALDMSRSEFLDILPRLKPLLRHVFFEGGRDIPLNEEARARILLEGIPGMIGAGGLGGLLDGLEQSDVLEHVGAACNPSLSTNGLWMFSDYVKGSGGLSRDAQIGSLSGGNHFVEFGYVESRQDKAACWKSGLGQETVTILAHNGSVGLGSAVASHFGRLAAEKHPGKNFNGMMPLSVAPGQAGCDYLHAMGLAANFALVNRVVLLWMARECVSSIAGRKVRMKQVMDSVHNMAWVEDSSHRQVIHRKGAAMAPAGQPLVVPGSSGTSTLVFTGLGFPGTHGSAPHGAGRIQRRTVGHREDIADSTGEILTQVDADHLPERMARMVRARLAEEAPHAYKPVGAIGDTVEKSGMGKALCGILPILSIKKT